ncbi:MAG: stage III sporulation protein AB [Alicyclobacillus sp.]|nr:stage III sporulation protein AB [Alicyclobacillus sp.]
MIRLVGSALVVVACAGMGFAIARGYRERPRQLQHLMEALRLLKVEIEFTATPLPQALRRVAERSTDPIRGLFAATADALARPGVTVAEAWMAGYEQVRRRSYLVPADLEVLVSFARTLGTSDSVHQIQHVDATLAQLEGLWREAAALQERYAKLAQYVGVLGGLFVVILLN